MDVQARRYELTLASDGPGDATVLELDDVTGGRRATVAAVRHADDSGAMTVSPYRRDLPLAAVEHLLTEARRRLPPTVVVVVDPDIGAGLAALAARASVWVADTPANRAAADQIWTRAAGEAHEVTTFRVDPDTAPGAWCAGVLPVIMDHHGGDGPHPRAGVLEVVGAALDPELAAALAAHGFTRLAPTEAGIRASVA